MMKRMMMAGACALVQFAVAAPVPQNVPELLRCEDGTKVSTVADWEGKRRGEIKEFFTREVYGRRPVERPEGLRFEKAEPDAVMMGGAAIRKRIRASWKGPRGEWSFVFTAFIPKGAADKGIKSPSFVLISSTQENIDPTRKKKTDYWPAEEFVGRGYAAIAFFYGDIAPDDGNPEFKKGVYTIYGDRGDDTWGAISAWAWGASRVLDWIETEPALDARHVGVVGHSRGGKTALVAAAMDSRFGMACSNDSGCSGAKLNHIDLPKSESVKSITTIFRHWFARGYEKWGGRENTDMPYDQHELIALIAPRLVAIASATRDDWAGQIGEFHAGRLASSAWELYGLKGLVAPENPPTVGDRPADGLLYQEGSVSYHIRPGGHGLTTYDWHRFMDFADRHGWRSAEDKSADKYGFVFFRDNGQAGVYLATSADGLNWKEANGGKPVLPAVLDDRITRDPSVCLGPDGVYHIVFTTSWKHRGFGVAHSKDLLTWSAPEFIPINEDWREAQNTWAPEIVWDDAQKVYVVVWATTGDARGHRQYYTTTTDFKTWSPRKLYYDPGHSVIDSFPFLFNGKWHLIAKDETGKPVAKKHLRVVRSKGGVCGPWEPEDEPFTDNTKFWAEGPTALQLDGGEWVVYFDCYNKGHYGACLTRDFKTFKDTPFTLPKGIRHGTAFKLK